MRNNKRKSNNNARRSNKSFPRSERKDRCDVKPQKGDDYEKKPSETNDPEWYSQTPDLLRDAASLPFSQAAGIPFNRNVYYGDHVIDRPISQQYAIPGIMTMTVIPIIGDSGEVNSPLNIASNASYAFVRSANSGARNYSAPNLFMYEMAIAQVYSYLNYLQRIYGTCQLYSHYNRYIPQAVIQAQNVDFTSVQNHLADFRYGINMLIHKAASFACPASMTYFKRLAFLFSGIYAEGESIKDQLYMYVPEGFLQFNETKATPGWQLKYLPFYGKGSATGGLHTVKDLIEYGENLLQPLLMAEDVNIISGDILKAYGVENLLGLSTIPTELLIMPVTDLTVLEQFQNADFLPFLQEDTSNYTNVIVVNENPDTNLVQSTVQTINTAILGDPKFSAAIMNTHVLTTILTNPRPEDVIERTRFMVSYNDTTDDSGVTFDWLTGSEIAVRLETWTNINGVFGKTAYKPNQFIFDGATVNSPTHVTDLILKHCFLENFKFHPTIHYFHQMVEEQTEYQWLNAAVDIDNFTTIEATTLQRMNEAALLSLFHVPSVVKFN